MWIRRFWRLSMEMCKDWRISCRVEKAGAAGMKEDL